MTAPEVKGGKPQRRRCRPCHGLKHTQCENILGRPGSCPCPCYNDTTGETAFWALIETARAWPHVMAARAILASSLRICWSKS